MLQRVPPALIYIMLLQRLVKSVGIVSTATKTHVDETYIRCDRCGEIMYRFREIICRVARFKNASATWRNLAAVRFWKSIAAPPRAQTATNSSGVSPPARCGNSETLTPDHLSRSFETLRNEPLTPKTQLDRGVDHNVDELCQECNASQEHRKRHLQNQVYICINIYNAEYSSS